MGRIEVGDKATEAESIHWCTPQWITDGAARVLNASFSNQGRGIGLDPCPNPGSVTRTGARKNLLLKDGYNGLKTDWRLPDGILGETVQSAYVNPPFGRYYFHPVTHDFLTPADVKRRVEVMIKTGEAKDKESARDRVLDGYESHSIREWIQRCSDYATYQGMDIIQLGPASVGSGWWQDITEATASAILYIRGRVKFELVDFRTMEIVSMGNSAPMDCAVALWTREETVLNAFGAEFGSKGRIHIL